MSPRIINAFRYEAEVELFNSDAARSSAKVLITKDAAFEAWSPWSRCSVSCVNEGTQEHGDAILVILAVVMHLEASAVAATHLQSARRQSIYL